MRKNKDFYNRSKLMQAHDQVTYLVMCLIFFIQTSLCRQKRKDINIRHESKEIELESIMLVGTIDIRDETVKWDFSSGNLRAASVCRTMMRSVSD